MAQRRACSLGWSRETQSTEVHQSNEEKGVNPGLLVAPLGTSLLEKSDPEEKNTERRRETKFQNRHLSLEFCCRNPQLLFSCGGQSILLLDQINLAWVSVICSKRILTASVQLKGSPVLEGERDRVNLNDTSARASSTGKLTEPWEIPWKDTQDSETSGKQVDLPSKWPDGQSALDLGQRRPSDLSLQPAWEPLGGVRTPSRGTVYRSLSVCPS